MTATISPNDASNRGVSWTIVKGTGDGTISSSGLLSAASNGTVTVTATSIDGTFKSGTKLITISNQATIKVNSITLSGENGATKLKKNGNTLQINASILPIDAANKTLTWTVNTTTGATISNSGLLTSNRTGSLIVTATSKDGSGVFGTITINITNN